MIFMILRNGFGVRSSAFKKPENSWEKWWYENLPRGFDKSGNSYQKKWWSEDRPSDLDKPDEPLKTTNLWGKIVEIVLNFRFFFLQYGIVYRLGIAGGSKSIYVYLISWIYIAIAAVIYVIQTIMRCRYKAKKHIYYQLVKLLSIIFCIAVIIILFEFTRLQFLDLLAAQLAFLPTGWGLISIAIVLQPLLEETAIWEPLVLLARFYEIIFGMIVLVPVAILSWLPGIQAMQSRILFNQAFSQGMNISQFLKRKNSKADFVLPNIM